MRHITTRLAGFLILVGGVWGGAIVFVGPYFHFTLGPDHAWRWTSGRLYLDVLPAIAAVVGGLVLLGAGPWLTGRLGALLALAGGIWFAIGPDMSLLWHQNGVQGAAHGTRGVQALEHLTIHTGLGVLIAALAAYALPGLIRAAAPAPEPIAPGTTVPSAARRRLALRRRGAAGAPRTGEPLAR
jgi:hypothetical protein